MFPLAESDYWIILTAVLVSVSCGLLGCYLVLRRMSLLGDAISHAILPGLAVAFFLSNSRSIGPMFLGAWIVGVLTAMLSAMLHRWGKVPEDASMGVVFTSLFALGVLMISVVASQVDLDPGCVLYGLIEFVPLDTMPVFGIELPRAIVSMGIVFVINVVFITLFFKELKIVSFDPALATSMGISAALIHYALMSLVALTTVAAFESVGSILVVAMLIAPGATAHLLTDRLGRMLGISVVVSMIAGVVGYLLAVYWNTSVAGMISVVAGIEFMVALFFAPRYGYFSKLLHQLFLSLRIAREDILGILYRLFEAGQKTAFGLRDVRQALGGGFLPVAALQGLRFQGFVEISRGGIVLTESGKARAKNLIRSHRLWESYLAKHFEIPLDHLHAPSERMEHFITGSIQEALGEELKREFDPQGKRIPPSEE